MAETRDDLLFNILPWWSEIWRGMPEFNQQDLSPEYQVVVSFRSIADLREFEKLFGQKIPASKKRAEGIWFPPAELGITRGKRYTTTVPVNPRYPVYIISKGRAESRLTSKALEKMGVPYRIVVEPQELSDYAAVIDRAKILVLPFSNLGQGSIPARNWVWEHAISEGHKRHWILDDNIAGFFRLNNNLKIRAMSGSMFRAAEDFADRYENVGQAGFNYYQFASRKDAKPPIVLNTRIYSCILIDNSVPHRWRGRYNEDTDLSIRILKDGMCTVLFNSFLAKKATTMTMAGGNTDQLYADNGRQKMAESLQEQHPDLVTITEKWGRLQHSVNYKVFAANKLKLKPGIIVPDGPDEYGMVLTDTNITRESDGEENQELRPDTDADGRLNPIPVLQAREVESHESLF